MSEKYFESKLSIWIYFSLVKRRVIRFSHSLRLYVFQIFLKPFRWTKRSRWFLIAFGKLTLCKTLCIVCLLTISLYLLVWLHHFISNNRWYRASKKSSNFLFGLIRCYLPNENLLLRQLLIWQVDFLLD